jgi:hypothetical protein
VITRAQVDELVVILSEAIRAVADGLVADGVRLD